MIFTRRCLCPHLLWSKHDKSREHLSFACFKPYCLMTTIDHRRIVPVDLFCREIFGEDTPPGLDQMCCLFNARQCRGWRWGCLQLSQHCITINLLTSSYLESMYIYSIGSQFWYKQAYHFITLTALLHWHHAPYVGSFLSHHTNCHTNTFSIYSHR